MGSPAASWSLAPSQQFRGSCRCTYVSRTYLDSRQSGSGVGIGMRSCGGEWGAELASWWLAYRSRSSTSALTAPGLWPCAYMSTGTWTPPALHLLASLSLGAYMPASTRAGTRPAAGLGEANASFYFDRACHGLHLGFADQGLAPITFTPGLRPSAAAFVTSP